MKVSLLIPSVSKNVKYQQRITQNIKELFGSRDDIEMLMSINDELSLSGQYNKLVKDSTGDVVVLLHDDMILHRNFVDEIKKHISERTILTYTRVEPPIFYDQYAGKVIYDCGRDIEDFDEDKFRKMGLSYDLIDGGSQLFFACYRKDYIGLDDETYKLFCEDDDLHLRYNILGYEKKVCSAMVYHFVSKTSRVGSYQQVEMSSNRNFIRKWSFRKSIYNKKMNITFKVKNCTMDLLRFLEPFSYNIHTDLPPEALQTYIQSEVNFTKFDLKNKLKKYDEQIKTDDVNAVVEFDLKYLTQDSVEIIQSLSDIIYETNDTGRFEVSCFNINILSSSPKSVKYIV